MIVSTHSRPKAAGTSGCPLPSTHRSFNTQPPEGGWLDHDDGFIQVLVSTHSRPKAAGQRRCYAFGRRPVSTHSRPKAAGTDPSTSSGICYPFQHTAARRRLVWRASMRRPAMRWFQHTAARRRLVRRLRPLNLLPRFNTQPPEGGWSLWNSPHYSRPVWPCFAKWPSKGRVRIWVCFLLAYFRWIND